jgi:lysozyme
MTSAVLLWAPVAGVAPAPPQPQVRLQPGDRGPDVASYQGYPDWQAVAASGMRFAFTKATEGCSYFNPSFGYNWSGIASAGLVRGAYHFAQPDDNAPEREADWFLDHVPIDDGDMLVLDLEVGSGDLRDWCLGWLIRCQSQTGRKALLYSGAYFMQDHGLCAPDIAAACSGLWLAAYTSSCPAVPHGFSEITFWQYTDKASVDGIQGGVDCNIYRP